MPEGDTVWFTARRLRDALAGRILTHADLRVPRYATSDLRGQTVNDVRSQGKHLLLRTADGWTLHSHLGMDGSWRVRRAHGRRLPGAGAADVRAVLANAQWIAVGSALARLDLVPTTAEDRLVGHLGPDLLGPDWDPGRAVERLAADPERPIVDALLDQTNLAGIGNVYQAELLFLRGIHPESTVGEVADLDRLVRLARRLLSANLDAPAHVTTGDRRRGEQHWVYGRGGQGCRRCGTPIASARRGPASAPRITYWCPSCQPGRALPGPA